MGTTISEQADNYAEVIVGQIADNFSALAKAVKGCDELKKAQKEYKKVLPTDNTLGDIDNVRKRIKIIENNLGDVVCDEYSTIEPLAVGLFGEWGSGKTHQLKLIKKKLIERSKSEKPTIPTVIPVFFNAWRFEKEEHIIIPLFQTLLDAVEQQERTLKDKAKRKLKSTAYHLKNVLLSLHKGINISSAYKTAQGVLTGDLEGMRESSNIIDPNKILEAGQTQTHIEQVGNQVLSELIKPDQLESIYLNIPQWIEKITLFEKVNFVFLIDDLDRCLPENTLKMLESIKLFLDVPSCAFVLAVDDDVVERGVVHHYRDYLQQNNNTIIYMDKKDVSSESEKSKTYELPITGHEYLEKMIQLPIRLPVIDEANAKEFLKFHSKKWIDIIVDNKNALKNPDDMGDVSKESEKLLTFFAKVVPAKPRKLIRTAKLFETKLLLLDGLHDKVDMLFVAKITLLELFAPELLRFIQNNGYGLVFNSLCHFREASYQFYKDRELQNELQGNQPSEPKEKFFNSLLDLGVIKKYIETRPGIDNSYTTKEKNLFHKALKIIEKYEANRITFDLDTVFEKSYDTEKLKLIVEMNEPKEKKELSSRVETLTDEFMIRLFRDGDVDAWKDAFKEHNTMISVSQLNMLIAKATEEIDKTFNNLTFIANPEWMGVVAEYIDEAGYINLLKASHEARFKTIKDKTQIDIFQLTFAEYDKYCELTEKKKPKDEGWGRGRRPVINVSWKEAKDYMEWLIIKNIGQYSLPTKDQWELACNLGKETKWYFDDDETKLKEYGWYDKNSEMQTHSVGSLEPNGLGLYDMHGNVWEWCKDWYAEDEDSKVLKGGSFISSASSTHSSNSYRSVPHNCDDGFGFRLLRTLP